MVLNVSYITLCPLEATDRWISDIQQTVKLLRCPLLITTFAEPHVSSGRYDVGWGVLT